MIRSTHPDRVVTPAPASPLQPGAPRSAPRSAPPPGQQARDCPSKYALSSSNEDLNRWLMAMAARSASTTYRRSVSMPNSPGTQTDRDYCGWMHAFHRNERVVEATKARQGAGRGAGGEVERVVLGKAPKPRRTTKNICLTAIRNYISILEIFHKFAYNEELYFNFSSFSQVCLEFTCQTA